MKINWMMFFLIAPTFLLANQKPDWDAVLKAEKIDSHSFTSQVKIDYAHYKGSPIWEIGQVLKDDFSGDGVFSLVVAFSGHLSVVYPPDEYSNQPWKGFYPLWGGFAYFQKEGEDWKLHQIERLGINFQPLKFIELARKEKGLLVANESVLVANESGLTGGNVAYVYRLVRGKFENVLSIDVNGGYGPEIIKEKGKKMIVVFQPSESLPIWLYHEKIYSWDASKFIGGDDPITKGEEEYRFWLKDFSRGDNVLGIEARNQKYKNGQKEFNQQYQKQLDVYEMYLKEHPKSFLATAYCAWLCSAMYQNEKKIFYEKKLLEIGYQTVQDCPHAGPKMQKWMKKNQKNVLERIRERNW